MDPSIKIIDCACVIHGDAYNWQYVERLYSMLTRNLSVPVRFHVYTEAGREVPSSMIKHSLTELPLARTGRAWWYKMQLFNPEHHCGPLLYFDLDTVIVDNIDWIWKQPPEYLWAIRDFKYLWRPNNTGINSSIMWWDTQKYSYVWNLFSQQNLKENMLKYHGDQDYISDVIPENQRRYFALDRIQSWRWQTLDGGYNFTKKRHQAPGTGAQLLPLTSILVFHGKPKPADVTDKVVIEHWR